MKPILRSVLLRIGRLAVTQAIVIFICIFILVSIKINVHDKQPVIMNEGFDVSFMEDMPEAYTEGIFFINYRNGNSKQGFLRWIRGVVRQEGKEDDVSYYVPVTSHMVVVVREVYFTDFRDDEKNKRYRDEFEDVLYHEVGHHVWYYKLTFSERKEFKELYERDYWNDTLISQYSRTNVKEGFAEEFAQYNTNVEFRDPLTEEQLEFFNKVLNRIIS